MQLGSLSLEVLKSLPNALGHCQMREEPRDFGDSLCHVLWTYHCFVPFFVNNGLPVIPREEACDTEGWQEGEGRGN